MALREEIEKSGNRLFRYRSYLPLLMVGMGVLDMRHLTYLCGNYELNLYWEILCLGVSFAGLAIRAAVVGSVPEGTSGRNTLVQKAVALNTTGLYSIVRHPLYIGNFFIWFGISMLMRHWYMNFVCILCFWVYYERIIFAEEEFLRREFGPAFEAWSARTPCFLPDFRRWQPPGRSFSWKKVFKDEYSSLFSVIVSYVFFDALGSWIVLGKVRFSWECDMLFLLGLSIYLTLRTVKKKGMLDTDSILERMNSRSISITKTCN